MIRRLLVCVAVFSVALTAFTAQSAKPRLAVKTFDNPSTVDTTSLGDAVTDIFFTELGRLGRFDLVERAAFDEIAKEVNFGATDWARQGTFATKGGALGADFILFGKVSAFSFEEHVVTAQVDARRTGRETTTYQQDASVRVDFRIVSTSTGVAVITESGSATQSVVSAISEREKYNRVVRVGVLNSEALDSLIGRTTVLAIKNAVRKINDLAPELLNYSAGRPASPAGAITEITGAILADVDGAFIVDVGSNQGVRPGDRFRVFGTKLTRDTTGAVVYREEFEIGQIEIMDVSMADRARGQLLPGPGATRPQAGDHVRLDLDAARALRSGSPAGAPSSIGTAPAAEAAARQGDRYLEDGYYGQAIDAFHRALGIQPRSPAIMGKLASAFIANRQLADAEDMLNDLFAVNGGVSIHVVHNHFFGYCTGWLAISAGELRYEPAKGNDDDAFRIGPRDVQSIDEGTVPFIPNLPSVVLRFRNQRGDNKKFDFVSDAYLPALPSGGLAGLALDADAIADTIKLHRIIIRMTTDRIIR